MPAMSFSLEIYKRQKKVYRSFLIKAHKIRKKKIVNSAFLYPCNWHECFSKALIQFIDKKNYFDLIYYFFKDSILMLSHLNYKLYLPKNMKRSYTDFAITWIKNSDISNGVLKNDRYLFIDTKNEKKLILCLNLEKKIRYQKKLKNIIIFSKDNIFSVNTIINFFIFIKFILINLLKGKTIYHLSDFSFFSYLLYSKIKKICLKYDFKSLTLPYEGQPFQNFLINRFRHHNNKIYILGIVKSLQPFPIHLYNNQDAPNSINYANKHIKEYMVKRLGWKKKQFQKKINFTPRNHCGKIILPFSTNNISTVMKSIKKIKSKKLIKNLKYFEVRIHPNSPETIKQINLKNNLEQLIEYEKSKKNLKINEAITIGSTTALLENLLSGLTVYHIFTDELNECLSNYFWPKIKMLKIDNNLIRYSMLIN